MTFLPSALTAFLGPVFGTLRPPPLYKCKY
jgi:hypothetical protein